MTEDQKIVEAKKALVNMIGNYIGAQQGSFLANMLRCEDRVAYAELILSAWETIKAMPATYDNEDKEMKDVQAHLHYFGGGVDVWVSEKDRGTTGEWTAITQQIQAFGVVCIDEPELGYVSLSEILEAGLELDLHWVKKDLESIYKAARNRGYN